MSANETLRNAYTILSVLESAPSLLHKQGSLSSPGDVAHHVRRYAPTELPTLLEFMAARTEVLVKPEHASLRASHAGAVIHYSSAACPERAQMLDRLDGFNQLAAKQEQYSAVAAYHYQIYEYLKPEGAHRTDCGMQALIHGEQALSAAQPKAAWDILCSANLMVPQDKPVRTYVMSLMGQVHDMAMTEWSLRTHAGLPQSREFAVAACSPENLRHIRARAEQVSGYK